MDGVDGGMNGAISSEGDAEEGRIYINVLDSRCVSYSPFVFLVPSIFFCSGASG